MADQGYEYSDGGSDVSGEEENQIEIEVENAFYEGDECKESNPSKAREMFVKVVKLETDNGLDIKWRFKALEHLVAIHCRHQDRSGMLQRYAELLAYISESAVTQNECTSAITSALQLTAGDGPETVSKIFEMTRSTLQASSRNERLWFSTLMRYGESLLRSQDYGQLAYVVSELHASCQLSDNSDDPTKGKHVLEVHALEMQWCAETKNTTRMKHIYLKTLDWKAIVLEPRVMGVIREEGGKMYMGEEKWYEACEEFYEGFRGYQEAGDPRAKGVFKYVVLANMLALSDIDPFAASETFHDDTDILAMQTLLSAYKANDCTTFVRTLENEANWILTDPFTKEFVEPLRQRMREQMTLQPLLAPEVNAGTQSSVNSGESASRALILAAAAATLDCRSALLEGPAASQAALAKHRAAIAPELAQALEIVGNYVSNEPGRTSLHDIVVNGDAATVEVFLAAGGEMSTNDSNGATALDLATDGTCRDILEHHAAVLAAITDDPTRLVSFVLAHCATLSAPGALVSITELDLRAYQLDPYFHWAPPAARARVLLWAVDALMVHHVANTKPFGGLPGDCIGDVCEFFELSMTPKEIRHVAMQCSSPEAYAWVRAVFTAAVASGMTALMVTSVRGHTTTMRNLLEAGANLNAEDWNGDTALMWASLHGHSSTVQLLVEAGADRDAANNDGDTALIIASKKGHTATVQLLLEAGADKEARSNLGSTALMHASADGHTATVQLLVAAGADMNAINNNGRTALDIANEQGHTAVVALL